ncbi:MAG TPA: hypothetical protein VH594_12565, partial [Trebonia sp.]
QHLAGVFWYPQGEPLDLLRVSQWAVAREGPGPLYDELRKLFASEYGPTRGTARILNAQSAGNNSSSPQRAGG